MTERTLAEILEDITAHEIMSGPNSPRVIKLREDARNHPEAAAGRDLPPIVGTIGRVF